METTIYSGAFCAKGLTAYARAVRTGRTSVPVCASAVICPRRDRADEDRCAHRHTSHQPSRPDRLKNSPLLHIHTPYLSALFKNLAISCYGIQPSLLSSLLNIPNFMQMQPSNVCHRAVLLYGNLILARKALWAESSQDFSNSLPPPPHPRAKIPLCREHVRRRRT